VVVSLTKDLMLEGRLPEPLNVAFHGLLAAVALMGFVFRRSALQLGLANFVGVTFAIYVGLLFAQL